MSVRFGASLASNMARLGLSFCSGLLVARGLGASRYGDYQFLLASVASLTQFLDAGSSQAFFTFISRRQRRRMFFAMYGGWLALQFVLVLAGVALIAPERLLSAIWLNHGRFEILLSFVATFLMNELWEAVGQLGEARRRTVVVQAALTCQAAAHLGLVAVALATERLSATIVFVFLVVEYGSLVAILGPRFLAENLSEAAIPETAASVVHDFYAFCRPLVVYAFCSLVFLFADRWLLQRFGGARQQGYFGIGQQFSTISLLATNAVLQVFWKEIAAATSGGDIDRARLLYGSTSRALYFVAAWISCLFIPYSAEILAMTLGSDFKGAGYAFSIMLLYPIHQSIGRISGSFLQAAGHTALYSKVSMVALTLSLPLSYLLLAPRSGLVPGLDLGAAGLTVKMVTLNILSVNLLAFTIARRFQMRYDWRHQIATVVLLLGLGFGSRLLAAHLVSATRVAPLLAVPALGGVFYLAMTAFIVFRRPAIVGLTPAQATSILRVYRQLMRVS